MAGDKPYPELPVDNKNYANSAVVIIGAGISGLCAAIDLIKRNGCRNFIILERSAGLGGTWHDNKYPGCCCDVWSTLYSFSFAQNSDWSREYPGQEEILAYLVKTAQEYNLYPHIRFNSTVEDGTWDDEAKKWKVRVTTPQGSKDAEFNPEYTITTDFLISAVGQLNQPKWPDIKGIETFEGKKMHSARWDWSYDLADKKIAVVGNGCTSAQIVPEIAKVAKQVTIFQRTPNWIMHRADQPVSTFMRGVYRYLPPIRWRKRAAQMDFREAFYDAVYDGTSELAEVIRAQHKEKLETELASRPDLWDKLTPRYNPGCKRVIITDDYFPALALPTVTVEMRSIDGISAHGVNVKNEDGSVEDSGHDFDLIVCATGFKTLDFLHPIQLYGKNGRSLGDIWKDGAQAYFATSVEDMPNLGLMYGPNSNLGHNSIILQIEAQSRYINGLIKPVLNARRQGKALSLRPKAEKVKSYNERIQAVLQKSSFNDPACQSWYKTEKGIITNNWSGTVVEYQKQMQNVDYDDYMVEGSGVSLVKEKPTLAVGRVKEESTVSDRTLLLLGAVSSAAVVGGWFLRNSRYLNAIRAH